MHDKRVQKGNTYAAMVIPAGSYPDTFGSSATQQQSATKRSTQQNTYKATLKVSLTFVTVKESLSVNILVVWCREHVASELLLNTLTAIYLHLNLSTVGNTQSCRRMSIRST
jgi:hypothetical protein